MLPILIIAVFYVEGKGVVSLPLEHNLLVYRVGWKGGVLGGVWAWKV